MKTFLILSILILSTTLSIFGQNAVVRAGASVTVSGLPSASTNTKRIVPVSDGLSAGDCSIGGGSTVVNCMSNGTVWTAVSATNQTNSDQLCRSTTGNDTYTCNVVPALISYGNGTTSAAKIILNAGTSNTGTATIAVNGLAAKSILNRSGAALSDGDITANKPITLVYDGTQFIIQGDGGGAGGGSVTSVTGACGISGTVTTSGTLTGGNVENAQTGTTYTIVAGDCGKFITATNASASTYTVPSAGGSFPDGFYTEIKNLGAGTVTFSGITASIATGESIRLLSNGSSWNSVITVGAAAGGSPGQFWGQATSGIGAGSAFCTITNVTTATPAVVTCSSSHFASTGQRRYVTGAGGVGGVNGTIWTITYVDATRYSLDGSTSTGTYTSGGSAVDSATTCQSYIQIFQSSSYCATSTYQPVPATGSLTSLVAIAGSTAQSSTGPILCYVRKNGTNTAFTVTMPASTAIGATAVGTGGPLSVTAGDTITLACENFATATGTDMRWNLK
jgi:hypothetical protein